VRIFIVDDQAGFRSGLRDLLSTVGEFEVVGEAADGRAAVEHAVSSKPDVILMDIRMPVMDGIAATRAIRSRDPDARVLVLTTFDDDELITEAIRAGAIGYVLKGTPLDDMAAILRLAVRGYIAIGRGKAQGAGRDIDLQRAQSAAAALSERETEIWQLIGKGLTNREIAKELSLTEGTVKNYVSSILAALGLRHRTEAALLWQTTRK
jgi:DNA-binding NarL/FixJ family response regulator